ncbi:MAG TPA: hypothetical protein VEF90_16765 [Xanthobacteraceae bacterium]|nr:hypothetical protein [Xanthobacteraceae bacterium]
MSTDKSTNQAFAYGSSVLGLQFHVEVPLHRCERWLIGHASELAAAGRSVPQLRAAAGGHAPILASKARALFDRWLDGIDPAQ